jgi:plasmid stabilization system protein ParE
MVKIIWTKRAFKQFERAIQYIREEQGLVYARIVYQKILESINLLEHQPQMGPREPVLLFKKSEYRFLVVWSYKIIYKVDSEKSLFRDCFILL